MEKVYGSPVRQDGLYKVGRNKWELIYGFGKDDETAESGCTGDSGLTTVRVLKR